MLILTIWIALSGTKVAANMVSQTSNTEDVWTGRRIDFQAFNSALSERRTALDQPELPRNSGECRTESKKALLKAIEDAGEKW